jgi:GntR family transcriptional regulator, transcriptional repressor for pyruvate dehydrogenase complex
MAEVVAEHIRRDVVTGVLAEGELLPAAAVLMERFGVSKPTIREALRILESETLIDVRRGATGARVTLPSEAAAARSVGILLQLRQTTLHDVAEARLVFEPWLAGRLARSRTEDDLAVLRKGAEASRAALGNPLEFAARQSDFHDLVNTLAGNQTLALTSRLLDEVVRRQAVSVNKDEAHDPLREAALAEHEELVRLIAQRREADAETLWRAHIKTNSDNLEAASGPHTVLDLYTLQARLELRPGL